MTADLTIAFVIVLSIPIFLALMITIQAVGEEWHYRLARKRCPVCQDLGSVLLINQDNPYESGGWCAPCRGRWLRIRQLEIDMNLES